MDRGFTSRILGALAGAAILAAYLFFARPRQLRWGATDEEVKRPTPRDEVVQNPTFVPTCAVTINAIPEDVWPWIIQIRYGRTGWYSYDWIDYLGRPSANNIIPELQHLKVGDLIPIIAVDFGNVVMMRKCMVGIKERAERTGQGAGGPINSKAEEYASTIGDPHAGHADQRRLPCIRRSAPADRSGGLPLQSRTRRGRSLDQRHLSRSDR